MTKPKRKSGGQSKYSAGLAQKICDEVAGGSTAIAAVRKHGIGWTTFWEWCKAHEWLANEYARAEEQRGQVLANELLELADTADAQNVNAVRLQVDTRKWLASKLFPRKFGDRVGLEHSGKDGGPLKVEIELVGGEE